MKIMVRLLTCILLLAASTCFAQELPVIRSVSALSFQDSRGGAWDTSKLKGKVSIINFFFASCQNVCPAMNKRLKESASSFLKDPRFQILSITVDPENDTADALNRYATYLGDNPYWYFLRGPLSQVETFLVKGLGIGSPDDITLHTTRLTLVDGQGTIRGYIPSSQKEDMNQLAASISQLLSELPSKP